MDIEDFIKVEHESPLYSNNNKEINFFMAHFYDTDSHDQVKQEHSQSELHTERQVKTLVT